MLDGSPSLGFRNMSSEESTNIDAEDDATWHIWTARICPKQ